MKLENYTGSPITQWILLGSPFSSDTKKTHEVFLVLKKRGDYTKSLFLACPPFFLILGVCYTDLRNCPLWTLNAT